MKDPCVVKGNFSPPIIASNNHSDLVSRDALANQLCQAPK